MTHSSFATIILVTTAYYLSAPGAAVAAEGKCTSIQAQCAMELGGTCDAKTGSWCYGHVYARNCGGGPTATAQFTACLSRKLGQKQ